MIRVVSPNARLAYYEVDEDLLSWENVYLQLKQELEASNKFRLAGPYVDLYFFSPVENILSGESPYWVGVEVIGQEDTLGQAWELIDLDASDIWEVELGANLKVSEILDLASKHRQDAVKKVSLANTWRIRVDLGKKETKIKLNFYEE